MALTSPRAPLVPNATPDCAIRSAMEICCVMTPRLCSCGAKMNYLKRGIWSYKVCHCVRNGNADPVDGYQFERFQAIDHNVIMAAASRNLRVIGLI